MVRVFKCRISVMPEAYIAGAAVLLLVPIPWASAWLFSAAWHELCHCISLKLCSHSIEEIVIGANDTEIRTGCLSEKETVICALAGPIGGLILLLFSEYFPKLGLCALLQSAFNLLPVYPLDGGRALRSIVCLLFPDRIAKNICNGVEAFLIILMLLGISFLNLGIFPVVIVVLIICKIKKIKIPCK